MKNFLVSLYFLFPTIFTIILVLLTPIPSAQLTNSETRILLQLQTLLEYPQEYPQLLQNNLTNFCNISSSPSFNIVCTKNHVTELTIIGNKTRPVSWKSRKTLSERFSIDSFFTVLTKLSNMKVLSLVKSLEVFNISSNFLYGKIPLSVSSMKNLKSLVLADNFFNGSVPNLKRLTSLEEVNFANNKLGPGFPSFLISLPLIQNLNLASNQFNGSFSMNISCGSSLTFVDISNNSLEGKLPSFYSGNCLSARNISDQHSSSHCKNSTVLAAETRFDKPKKSMMQLGVLFGIIGGFVVIVGLLILLFLFILRKSKAEREDSKIDHRSVDISRESRPNIYAKEIGDATNNFDPSNLIGEGSQREPGRRKEEKNLLLLYKSLLTWPKPSIRALVVDRGGIIRCALGRNLVQLGQMMQVSMMATPEINKELHYLNKEDKLLRWLLVKQARHKNWA
ncbi:LRR receptor-like kinase family protein, putative [Medicago truncatula]|uniref:LRR receptor-like kinase family protein, putative n=1 Tax=Medicago truncatula TaxID=3880 RepID=G7K706_MEDTR|nr:LRR receptor-like kinase family protein, putative [Medicago truncatula]